MSQYGFDGGDAMSGAPFAPMDHPLNLSKELTDTEHYLKTLQNIRDPHEMGTARRSARPSTARSAARHLHRGHGQTTR